MENNSGQTMLVIQATDTIIRLMDRVSLFMLMEIYTKATDSMIRLMGKEGLYMLMEMFT